VVLGVVSRGLSDQGLQPWGTPSIVSIDDITFSGKSIDNLPYT